MPDDLDRAGLGAAITTAAIAQAKGEPHLSAAIRAYLAATHKPLPTREDVLTALLAVPAKNYEFDYNAAADVVLALFTKEPT